MEKSQQMEGVKRDPDNVVHMDMTWEGGHIKISIQEQDASEISSIQHYDEVKVSLDNIEQRCSEIVDTLNSANQSGRISNEILSKLREVGQIFYDELFSQHIKSLLQQSKAAFLRLNIDDKLVQIPWELLFDGDEFLCQRFMMGRSVKTRQVIPLNKKRQLNSQLKMLLIADPEGDLNGAYKEGIQIRNYFDRHNHIVLNSIFDNISPDTIKEKIRNYDIVHFAGHADYNLKDPKESGWRLTKSRLNAEDIIKMAGASPMPALVFSNACQSARTEKWQLKDNFQNEIFGLANAFLLSGVKHYIGTWCEILDEPSSHFALRFYEKLRSGRSIGEAMHHARKSLINEFGEETIVWASYIMYGDPTFTYTEPSPEVIPEEKPMRLSLSQKVRTSKKDDEEEVILFDPKEHHKKRLGTLILLSSIALLAIMLCVSVYWFSPKAPPAQIQMITADDQKHQAIIKDIQQKMVQVQETRREERIEKLMQILEDKMPDNQGITVAPIEDPYLTLMMDFRSNSIQNGKEQLIASLVAEQIIANAQIKIVERYDLDKILAELHLGTSKLVNPSTALSLGNILSAKLILSGWVGQNEDLLEISMRVSEIETGKTVVAVNEVLNGLLPLSAQKEQLTKNLIEKLSILK